MLCTLSWSGWCAMGYTRRKYLGCVYEDGGVK